MAEEKDLVFLKDLIQTFTETTGSEVGQRILDSWTEAVGTFVKVGHQSIHFSAFRTHAELP